MGAIIVIHMEAFKITETDLGAAQDTIADQIVEKKTDDKITENMKK